MPSADADLRGRSELIAGRYRPERALGEGGMGSVLLVRDEVTRQTVALKRLRRAEQGYNRAVETMFEREYHTLAELAHPAVVEVYDYGVDDEGPYYTMEWLSGEDLAQMVPLPWERACAFARDVCSALALMHSRRLVHRDVTPRNIRIVDRRAKLFDFGAMMAMGPCKQVVGTPMFIAPETAQRQALDGRTDLYSLGVVLYRVIGSRYPYRAHKLSQLAQAWATEVVPLRGLCPDIPAALDQLVMSLIALEPMSRPRNAAEVLDRLTAIAGLDPLEQPAASRAYLSTPRLVGRDRLVARTREVLERAKEGRGEALIIHGDAGTGRSRALDAVVLEAKLLGATVLRADAGDAKSGPFGTALALARQLLQELPESAKASSHIDEVCAQLLSVGDEPRQRGLLRSEVLRTDLDAQRMHLALKHCFVALCGSQGMLLAVDDLSEVDEASVGVLAALAGAAPGHPLVVAATARGDSGATRSPAERIFRRRARTLKLEPLDAAATAALVESVFGPVPNVRVVADRVHQLCQGRPRQCMELSQYLIDRGLIRYEAGGWSLPAEIEAEDLPHGLQDAYRQRIESLSEDARWLAQLRSLAEHDVFSIEHYSLAAPHLSPAALHGALDELIRASILRREGDDLVFEHEGWPRLLRRDVDRSTAAQMHRLLADVLSAQDGDPVAALEHLFRAGAETEALDRMERLQRRPTGDQDSFFDKTPGQYRTQARACSLALEAARRHQRSPWLVHTLEYRLAALSLFDASLWNDVAPSLLERLKRDSGWTHWQSLDTSLDPSTRITRAMAQARECHERTPEAQRGFAPDEALIILLSYTYLAVCVSTLSVDYALKRSLPDLLAPFAPLSPDIASFHQNALATWDSSSGRPRSAYNRWKALIERRTEVSGLALARAAGYYALGSIETTLGIETAGQWADKVDDNANASLTLNAILGIRMPTAYQQGDWREVERWQKRAEQLIVERNPQQLFGESVRQRELSLYALAGDMIGVKQTRDRIRPLAKKYPGWVPWLQVAEGVYQGLRGDWNAALSRLERSVELTDPEGARDHCSDEWLLATGLQVETLLKLDRHHEAKQKADRAMRICAELRVEDRSHLTRALALAEAKLGDVAGARKRLEQAIATATEEGVTGLQLGLLYETCARLAIDSNDRDLFEHYARLTGEQYVRQPDSWFRSKYEALLGDAKTVNMDHQSRAGSDQPTVASFGTSLADELPQHDDLEARSRVVLDQLLDSTGCSQGYVFVLRHGTLHMMAPREAAPSERLLQQAREYLDAEIDGMNALATMVTLGTICEGSAYWYREDGKLFTPILLFHVDADGSLAVPALAALAPSEVHDVSKPPWALIQQLSLYLQRLEDVTPRTCLA